MYSEFGRGEQEDRMEGEGESVTNFSLSGNFTKLYFVFREILGSNLYIDNILALAVIVYLSIYLTII